jgi:peptidoglycan/LPS O-acetylase OafA/YrhL
MSPRYRPDIDGLRAVAIVPVILFHYAVPGFSGGFVGVDVFFVISGYLIASLIHSELREHRFSILNFYERRIRRIFPALFFLIAVVTVAGFFLLFPVVYRRYGETAVTTSLFVSNFKFFEEAGYFDLSASEKPLLHTWSLAVEEQFYLIFPPMLMLSQRYLKARHLIVVVPVLALSLGYGIWSTYAAPVAAFYLLPARFWELMLGALFALGNFPSPSPATRGALAWLGIVAIAVAVVAISARTPFPGAAALLPCAGAALVIYAGTDGRTLVHRWLAARLVVFIGLISYSLYLWHWPILIFARYAAGRDLSALESAALIAASFAIATFSWRYIEQPFRRRTALAARTPLFLAAGAAVLTTVAAGLLIELFQGVPQRFDPALRSVLAVAEERNPIVCAGSAPMTALDDPPCVIGAAQGETYDFILWGDSHADAISPAIAAAAANAGKKGLKAGEDACPPLLGVWHAAPSQCADALNENNAIHAVVQKYDVKTVILSARWAVYALGTFVKLEEDPKIFLNDADSHDVSFAEDERVFRRAFKRTVETLRSEGRRVVIVGPWPEIGLRVPETLARARYLGISEEFGPTREEFLEREAVIFDVFHEFADDPGVEILYPHEQLCDGRCKVVLDGQPLYWDDDHLSRLGALKLRPLFDHVFR